MKRTNFLIYVAYSLLISSVILIVVYAYVLYADKDFQGFPRILLSALKSNFGDVMSGTIGILLSLAATLFLFITFKEQRKQFNDTQNFQEVAKFEDTFFNIMSLLSDVRRTTIEGLKNHHILTIEGYYYNFCNFCYMKSNENCVLKSYQDKLQCDAPQESVISTVRTEVGEIYKDYVDKNEGSIGYFFRYIYNLLKFIKEQNNKMINKSRYINLLQSQLSDEELCLIFYDAISPYGKNKKGEDMFYNMLEESEMLENISEKILISRSHAKFYPLTKFKFLSRKELALVEERRKVSKIKF